MGAWMHVAEGGVNCCWRLGLVAFNEQTQTWQKAWRNKTGKKKNQAEHLRINWGSLTQIKRARWLETWTRCNWWRKNRTWPKPRAKLKNQTKVQNTHNHFREDQLWRKLISAAGIWDLCLWSWPIPYFFSSFLLLKKGNIIFFGISWMLDLILLHFFDSFFICLLPAISSYAFLADFCCLSY